MPWYRAAQHHGSPTLYAAAPAPADSNSSSRDSINGAAVTDVDEIVPANKNHLPRLNFDERNNHKNNNHSEAPIADNGQTMLNAVAVSTAAAAAAVDGKSGKAPWVEPPREKWANKLEFLLSVIGFSVDLGNVWRFPYICYRNGGGAFLIPYFIMFLFGGLPLFYMELALGQHKRSGCLSIWKKVSPLFKGIGFAICFISTYIAFFYNTIISWAVYFMISAMAREVPWKSCNNSWNTPNCSLDLTYGIAGLDALDGDNGSLIDLMSTFTYANGTNVTTVGQHQQYIPDNYRVSAAEEYFLREVLEIHKSDGLNNLGGIKWSLALCLFFVYVVVYFALWKGPRSSGKAVWVTATAPYIVLLVLLVHGAMLPGASDGVYYYLTPKWESLKQTSVWIDAATQVFFSLGPGFGVLLALASYNDFNNNCYRDAILTSVINCVTSLISGFVIFCTLGYMSKILKKDIDKVAGEGGPGLVFIVYPQAIATMEWSPFWATIFFFMLITLGIDSTFAGLEALITAFCDEFPRTLGRKRELFVLGLIIYCYIGSLATTTYGGNYLVEFLDHYGVSFSILFVVVIETVAVCWFYGVKRFSLDVEQMLGFQPGFGWRACWLVISPVFIMIIFFFACMDLKPLEFMGYRYPDWSVGLGWIIRSSSLICIPGYMVYKLLILKGSFTERLRKALTPVPDKERASAQYCLVPTQQCSVDPTPRSAVGDDGAIL